MARPFLRAQSGGADPGCGAVRACLFRHAGQHRDECGAHARIELGEYVAVIGLGLVGQLVAQLVRLQGGVVMAIDLTAGSCRHGDAVWAPITASLEVRDSLNGGGPDQWTRSGLRDRGGGREIAGACATGAADSAAIAAASSWSARWG